MKRRLYFAAIGALLSAAALSLGGCSKEKTPDPEGQQGEGSWGNRHVFLRIENRVANDHGNVHVHFNYDRSHANGYSYFKNATYWEDLWENDRISVNDAKFTTNCPAGKDVWLHREPKTDGGVNFFLDGSTVFTWHQRIVISWNGDDQENLMIKGESNGNIQAWIPWKNPRRKVEIEIVRVMFDNFEDDENWKQVYIYVRIWPKNGSEGEVLQAEAGSESEI